MDTDGVKVFHGADGDHVAVAVAQHFEFDLFPSVNVLLYKDLRDRRKHEPVVRDRTQLLFVIGNAAARSAERKCGTDDDGIPDLFRNSDAFLHRIGDVRRHDGLTDLLHRFLEKFPIFCPVYRLDLRSDQFDSPFIEETFLCQLTADRKPRLSAQRREQTVRTFLDNNALDGFERKRFEINFVRKRLVRHDRCGV